MQPEDARAIRICPYDERTFSPLLLVTLWQRIRDEKMSPMVWRHGELLSLNEFIRFYGPTQNRVLLLPFFQPDDNGPLLAESIMGMMWLDEFIQPEGRCYAHFAFFRKWHGGWPEATIRKTLRDCVFAPPMALRMVLCMGNADNDKASALWDRLGIHRLGTVPHWYHHADGWHGADFGYIPASDFLGEHHGTQPRESVAATRSAFRPATDQRLPATKAESPGVSGLS